MQDGLYKEVSARTSEQARAMAMVHARTKQTEQTSEQTIEFYMLTLLHASTNVPLSSARLPTSFQQPQEMRL